MGLLFNSVSGIGDNKKSGSIFDAVVSFEARLAVLDAALNYEKALTPTEHEIWALLSARLRKLYKKRHEVAHFSITDFAEDARPGISPFFSWNRHAHESAKFLTLEDLKERCRRFSQARWRLCGS